MSEHKLNPLARGTLVGLPAQVRDLYGRVLQEGDQIILNTPQVPQLYRVKSITPNVDPKFPENQMVIVLTAAQRFLATRDQPNPEFVRVVESTEAKPATEEPPPSAVVRES